MSQNRINLMLSKIGEILNQKGDRHAIDAALMIDYTKIIYADLLDLQKEWSALEYINHKLHAAESTSHIVEESILEPMNLATQSTPNVSEVLDVHIDNTSEENVQNSHDEQPESAKVREEPLAITEESVEESIVEPLTEEATESTSQTLEQIINNREEDIIVERLHAIADTPKPLTHYIGLNDKYLFISELFQGDKDAYQLFIETMSSFHNILDAEQFIQESYNWNKEDSSYQLLQGVLVSYFNNYK